MLLLQQALGDHIRQLRNKRRWTQKLLAEKVGVEEVGNVGKWERGEVFPDPGNLVALAKAFNIRMQDLFTFPKEPDC
jgi:transcriptional regulator with XRE-family HTH domain